MDGKVILIIGQRGSGKTTRAKNLIKSVHPSRLWIYGYRAGQYDDIYSKPVLKLEQFTKICTEKFESVFLFEEATIFLSHSKNTDVIDLLVASRERKNTVIFVFHSLRSIPRYVWDLSDIVFLHKTKDVESLVQSRFESDEFTNVFKLVNSNANPYHCLPFET